MPQVPKQSQRGIFFSLPILNIFSGTTIVTNNVTVTPNNQKALPLYFDLLLDNDVIRKMELERALIQETKKSGYELTKKIADFNILS
jgi:hypothetical protein